MGNAFHSDDPPSSEVIDQWRQRIRLSTAANYHYQMGLALADSGATAAAIDNFRKSVELTPDHLGARYDLEQLLAAAGQPATLAPLDPMQRQKGLIQHVACLLEAGKAGRARQVLADVPAPGADDKVLVWARAVIDLLAGGAEEGVPPSTPLSAREMDILAPLHVAFLQAAQKCLQWGRADAIHYYDAYCALVPDDESVQVGRATALILAVRPDEARPIIDALPAEGAVAIRQRAVLRISLDDGEAALAELGRLTETPVHGMTAALHAATLLLLGQTEAAADRVLAAEQALPGNPWVQVVRTWLERAAGHAPTARLDANIVGIRSVLSRLPGRITALLAAG